MGAGLGTLATLPAFPFPAVFFAPLLAQGVLIAVDEFHFHRQRGLPRWERLGHPLDTITTIACFLVPLLFPFGEGAALGYAGACAFSCVFVTKDEWVHARLCPPAEVWLHAMLFVVHPLVFLGVGFLWWAGDAGAWGLDPRTFRSVVTFQAALMAAFLCYQVTWWGLLGKGRWPASHGPAGAPATTPVESEPEATRRAGWSPRGTR